MDLQISQLINAIHLVNFEYHSYCTQGVIALACNTNVPGLAKQIEYYNHDSGYTAIQKLVHISNHQCTYVALTTHAMTLNCFLKHYKLRRQDFKESFDQLNIINQNVANFFRHLYPLPMAIVLQVCWSHVHYISKEILYNILQSMNEPFGTNMYTTKTILNDLKKIKYLNLTPRGYTFQTQSDRVHYTSLENYDDVMALHFLGSINWKQSITSHFPAPEFTHELLQSIIKNDIFMVCVEDIAFHFHLLSSTIINKIETIPVFILHRLCGRKQDHFITLSTPYQGSLEHNFPGRLMINPYRSTHILCNICQDVSMNDQYSTSPCGHVVCNNCLEQQKLHEDYHCCVCRKLVYHDDWIQLFL